MKTEGSTTTDSISSSNKSNTADQTVSNGASITLNGNGSGVRGDHEQKLRAVTKERDSLKEELVKIRLLLDNRESESDDSAALRSKLEEVEGERDKAKAQYQTLLGRVGTIKAQLDERLKSDEVCPLLDFSHPKF